MIVFRQLLAAAALALVFAAPAQAARVGVLSNANANETAADFNLKVLGHTFVAVDVASTVPTGASLLAQFDVLLLFEDGTFANSAAVGNAVAQFAQAGRAVVLGTFYEQDRSDMSNPSVISHGWGALESIDANTSDGFGTAYAPRSLNPASIVNHPLTAGVTSLSAEKFAGGNDAKPGTTVLATWNLPNARGRPDPAIAYTISGVTCVIHIGIAPDYAVYGTLGGAYAGDFYRLWKNAFDFGAEACARDAGNIIDVGDLPPGFDAIPTLGDWGLAATSLMLLAVAYRQRRRLFRR